MRGREREGERGKERESEGERGERDVVFVAHTECALHDRSPLLSLYLKPFVRYELIRSSRFAIRCN